MVLTFILVLESAHQETWMTAAAATAHELEDPGASYVKCSKWSAIVLRKYDHLHNDEVYDDTCDSEKELSVTSDDELSDSNASDASETTLAHNEMRPAHQNLLRQFQFLN
ncbi:hypothetical protein NDU88_001960 [Pleurodeles waltl]|uniref:Uncharacterized protein n=1 Tax=Pleurodeles waltl TaxID=8319 RepID=A0AAV7LN15_PLEWA|nr:hypothetical protein NDU88_001960 [Pleurodeles waltl]